MLALKVLLLLQVPLAAVLVNKVVLPRHTLFEPLIAEGVVLTTSVVVAVVETPQEDVAEKVYTPEAAKEEVKAAGLRKVDVKPFGPAQL